MPSLASPSFALFILEQAGKSGAAFMWAFVGKFWSQYWEVILLFFVLWVGFELLTRNGGVHFNSANGFSPTFNRVIGSGTYLLLQAGVFLIIRKLTGEGVYFRHFWPLSLHILVFISTGFLLRRVRFWKY